MRSIAAVALLIACVLNLFGGSMLVSGGATLLLRTQLEDSGDDGEETRYGADVGFGIFLLLVGLAQALGAALLFMGKARNFVIATAGLTILAWLLGYLFL